MNFKLQVIDEKGNRTDMGFEATTLKQVLTKLEQFLNVSGFNLGRSEHLVIWDEDLEELQAISDSDWKGLENE